MSVSPGGNPGDFDSASFAGTDPSADHDSDGLQAFLEHALGSDDTDPVSGPGLFAAGRDGEFVTFTYRRNLSADDAAFLVETSADLVEWTPDASLWSETPNGDGTSTVTFRAVAPIRENEELFLRLRVDRVTPLP